MDTIVTHLSVIITRANCVRTAGEAGQVAWRIPAASAAGIVRSGPGAGRDVREWEDRNGVCFRTARHRRRGRTADLPGERRVAATNRPAPAARREGGRPGAGHPRRPGRARAGPDHDWSPSPARAPPGRWLERTRSRQASRPIPIRSRGRQAASRKTSISDSPAILLKRRGSRTVTRTAPAQTIVCFTRLQFIQLFGIHRKQRAFRGENSERHLDSACAYAEGRDREHPRARPSLWGWLAVAASDGRAVC